MGTLFLRKVAGKRRGCKGRAWEKCIDSRDSAASFYSFIFLFRTAERLYVGTAAGLEDLC
ncbi:MAG TPA: hypothetical protein DEB74_12125 [Lachnospiraceae bacterium]|nr:hypothetical protein [Lachnospiraceae bacterium]